MSTAEIVTLLFTDLVGSTDLLEELGEEGAEELRQTHFALLREAVGAHRGSEVKNLGDGLMAVFGSAVDAVACALAIQRGVADHNRRHVGPELSLRVGLHLGEPIRSENDYFGTAVVVAKRLCDRAAGGEILASQLVADLVGSRRAFRFASVGKMQLKGLAEPLPAVAVHPGAPDSRRRAQQRSPVSVPLGTAGDPALAGRQIELETLDSEVGWSVTGQFRCCLITGDAGVGKTALAGEVLARHRQELLVLTARAHGFEEASPFGLWWRALDRYLRGLDAAEAMELCGVFLDDLTGVLRSLAAIRGLMGQDLPAKGRLLDGLTAVLGNLAARRPVAVFLDDIHRADRSTWDALEHIAHQLVDDAVFVLAAGRESVAEKAGAVEVAGRLEEEGLLRRIVLGPTGCADNDGPVSDDTLDGDPAALMATAQHALGHGDVAAAVGALTAALAKRDMPEAHDFLAGLHFANEDLHDCRRHWEAAFRGYRDAGNLRAAARVAIWLAELHYGGLGHEAAGRGWLGRATRLVDQVGHCVERGYLELAMIACNVRSASALEASGALALELAVEFGDAALEARALADSGLAFVTQGRIAEGFSRLDEAMVPITTGELTDPTTAGMVFCAMLTACDRAGDLGRAEEWSRLCLELLVEPLDGRFPVLHADCRVAYGSVLCATGRWPEAETEILRALGPAGTRYTSKRSQAIAQLAGLRIGQGRLEEAAELLRPVEDRFEVAEPLARLHLVTGKPDLASAVIGRTLGELVGDRLRTGPLLALLIEVELDRGDVDAAETAAGRLAECSQGAESPVLRALAARAAGLVAQRRGHHADAISSFRTAERELSNHEHPLLGATIRLEAAQALADGGETAAAVTEARAALSSFERLGSGRNADRAAAFLRGLGVAGRSRHPNRRSALGELTTREGEVLTLIGEGHTNAEIARRLYITAKTAEHHVGRILTKLGVRTRTEAAAIAAAEAVSAN
jgi:class 3 adenylate cyclase/DNA-binding NarL/FixJ family response regulator